MLALIFAFTLNVTAEDVQTLGKALGELPYREAAPLVRKLDEQLREQQKPAPQPVPETEKK